MTFNEKHELMKSYVSIRCIQCQTITHYYHCIDWSEHECECGVKVGVVVKDRFTDNTNVVIYDDNVSLCLCRISDKSNYLVQELTFLVVVGLLLML